MTIEMELTKVLGYISNGGYLTSNTINNKTEYAVEFIEGGYIKISKIIFDKLNK
jgi:hypothetical protein